MPRAQWELACELSRLGLTPAGWDQREGTVRGLIAQDFERLTQLDQGEATGDNLSPTEREMAALRWDAAFAEGKWRADPAIARKVLLAKREEGELEGLWLVCAVPSRDWLRRPPAEAIAHYAKLVDPARLVLAWRELGYLQAA